MDVETINLRNSLTATDHILDGYRKALKAVKVNGTSIIVIDTLTELVNNTRNKRNEIYDLLEIKSR